MAPARSALSEISNRSLESAPMCLQTVQMRVVVVNEDMYIRLEDGGAYLHGLCAALLPMQDTSACDAGAALTPPLPTLTQASCLQSAPCPVMARP